MTDGKKNSYRFLEPNLTHHGVVSVGLDEIKNDLIWLKHGIQYDRATINYIDDLIKKVMALEKKYQGDSEEFIRRILKI